MTTPQLRTLNPNPNPKAYSFNP